MEEKRMNDEEKIRKDEMIEIGNFGTVVCLALLLWSVCCSSFHHVLHVHTRIATMDLLVLFLISRDSVMQICIILSHHYYYFFIFLLID